MTQMRAIEMVEPTGIEPVTSTMPLSLSRRFLRFLQRHLENGPRTERKLHVFSVPVGPNNRATNPLERTAALTNTMNGASHGY